jgi:hypothetical protein
MYQSERMAIRAPHFSDASLPSLSANQAHSANQAQAATR